MCSYNVYAPLAYKTVNVCAMVQALSRRPFTAEVRVRNQAGHCETRVSQSGTGTVLSPSATIFPFHYLSAIASYSYFIHPLLTLYDVSYDVSS